MHENADLPSLTSAAEPGVSWSTLLGLVAVTIAIPIYWASAHLFDAGRPDLFYLADAFLHGRTWLSAPLGPYDVVPVDGRYYVPFAPFPALLFMPLVAIIGPASAHVREPIINALVAGVDVGMCWILLARLGVERLRDRLWLTALLAFSTPIWWVATRGGVWHTGHLVATALTLAALIEVFGRRRMFVIGLLAGAAFLSRAPLAFAVPFYAAAAFFPPTDRPTLRARLPAGFRDLASWPFRSWILLGAGVLPSILFFFWYNAARFGSPLESGYELATLPQFLEVQRAQGLFSLSHLGMNIDYMFLRLPTKIPNFPWFRPDGLGLSILLTSPGLLLAIRASWRTWTARWLGLAFVAVLLPNLLYYGGGWLQYGYRYALDAIPFALALCGLAAARYGVQRPWQLLILFGIVVNLGGVYWAYNL